MKLLARLTLLGAVVLSQSAWAADAGPFYVSYPGYCNVRKVYVTAINDLYGTEVGCASLLGSPIIGTMLADGRVTVSAFRLTSVCINVYWPNGALTGGCSDGGPIIYPATSTYSVRQSILPTPPAAQYKVSADMPDLENTKDLPMLP